MGKQENVCQKKLGSKNNIGEKENDLKKIFTQRTGVWKKLLTPKDFGPKKLN